ncbi:hypothetical protein [Candidatus Pelagibacter sp. Uisw_113]|uniref:hypothetical protein n=1 Tax=Candidatus Pelagibacter sp. Uisw_113 TaxID=3230994 RepID=UPI0039E9FE77
MKQIVKNFNNLIKKTIFKLENKTNNNFQVSTFNKYVIAIISILFIYIFYLLIPLLYDKNWLQNKITEELKNEFNISLINTSDISYRILPRPHFSIINSTISLAKFGIINIYINQNNFFNKNNLAIDEVIIHEANFSLFKSDLKRLSANTKNKFSTKKIKINNSNIFFKDNLSEITAIIKISNASIFFDEKKLLNLTDLKGQVFNIPFSLNYQRTLNSKKSKRIEIEANDLGLKIINERFKLDENLITGTNSLSVLNSTIITKYNVLDKIIEFKSSNSRMHNSKVNYNGRLGINPFDLDLKIDLDNYKISDLFISNSIINEFIKSGLLFNENISINTLINVNSKIRDEIFNDANIKLKILNGKINFDNSIFISDDIGSLEISNSDLFLKSNKLTLATNLSIDIKDIDKLFSFLNTSKNSRKDIKNIKLNVIYDFATNQIEFKNIKINDNEVSDQFKNIVETFADNNSNNLTRSRRILNELIGLYEG